MSDGIATLEDSLMVSYRISHTFTIPSAVRFLGIYQKKLKTYVPTKTYTPMFIEM